jgi:predicted O-linked N-acetylglucosamine transferase (SPINDLY family)
MAATRGASASTSRSNDVANLLSQGILLQQSGDLDQAESIFKKALKLSPQNAPTLYSLAALSERRNDLASALRFINQAVAAAPNFAQAVFAKSVLLTRLGRGSDAIAFAEKAQTLDPKLPGLADHLRFLQESADRSAAQGLSESTGPAIQSGHLATLQEALTAQADGDLAKAEALFRGVLEQDPRDYIALYSLGFLANQAGNHKAAVDYFQRALAVNPGQADAHYALATVLQSMGLFEDALSSFDAAIALNPKLRGPHLNKSGLLHSMNRQPEAVVAMDFALEQIPDDPGLLNNKGYLLTEFKRYEEAASVFKRLIDVDRDYENALGLHAFARLHACDWTNFYENQKEIVEKVLEGKRVCNPLAFMALTDSAAAHHACAKTFAKFHFGKPPEPLWRGERYAHRRKRVAFLSADFREHPVGYLLIGLIENLRNFPVETIGVSFGNPDSSNLYKRFRSGFTHYLECQDKTSAEVARILRAMEADILIDLSGYTSGSKLDVLLHRPAPAQATYLGFPGGLGLDCVDYLITDAVTVPPETEAHFTERVIRLPHCYLPRDTGVEPSPTTPDRRHFGLPEKGLVFCSFNHDYKINPPLFDVWMSLLEQRKDSVLWLMRLNEAAERNLKKEAQALGVDPARLVFAQRVPKIEDHLARYRHVDLFLDCFPYNGHTTASDALSMNVRYLAYQGEGFASRVSSSLMHDLGRDQEDVATSLEDYKSKALKIADSTEGRGTSNGQLSLNRHSPPNVAQQAEEFFLTVVDAI